MSDLYELLLGLVRWLFIAIDRVLDGLGLGGGALDGLFGWLGARADHLITALFAAAVLAAWTILTGGLAEWLDRRVRARVEGRVGPRYHGVGGVLQGWADWVKLKLKMPSWSPSSAAAVLSGAMALAALSVMPLGPWGRLADPSWGVVAAAALLALAPLPLAAVAPPGRRVQEAGAATASGVLLLLSVATVTLVAGSGSGDGLVSFQREWGWFILLAPLSFAIYLYSFWLEAGRLDDLRRTGREAAARPGPRQALSRYALAARYYSLGVLGALCFLGGWSGPGPDGLWWTLLKAYVLVALVSFLSAAMPIPRPGDTARSARSRWLPIAALNLVVAAAILEVMG